MTMRETSGGTISAMRCTACGTRIHDDTIADARAAAKHLDEFLCERCDCEQHHFTCASCQECGEKQVQHAFVVVTDPLEAAVALAGLYRVEKVPYAVSSLTGGGWLYPSALTWLGFLEEVDSYGYPCGHLCGACQERLVRDLDTHAVQMMWAAL